MLLQLEFIFSSNIKIILGKALNNEWITLSLQPSLKKFRQQKVKTLESLTPGSLEVISVFKETTDRLLFPSISLRHNYQDVFVGYPFDGFIWQVARSKNKVIENILKQIEFIKIERLNNNHLEMLVNNRYDTKSIERLDLFFEKLETDLNIKNLRVCRFGFEEEITEILG